MLCCHTGAQAGRPLDDMPGMPVPDFELLSEQGQRVAPDTLEGHTTVLVFATMDGYSTKGLAQLNKLIPRFAPRGVQFYVVAQQQGNRSLDKLLERYRRIAPRLTVLTSDYNRRNVAGAFRITAYPSFVVIGSHGVIEYAAAGAMLGDDFTAALDRAIAKPQSTSNFGQAAPAFELRTVDRRVFTNADLLSKIVLITLWHPNDPQSNAHVRTVEQLHEVFTPDQVQFLVVAQKGKEPFTEQETLQEWQALEFNSPLVIDLENHVGQLLTARQCPATFIIDAQGVLVGVEYGQASRFGKSLAQRVEALLAGLPASHTPIQAADLKGGELPARFALEDVDGHPISADFFKDHGGVLVFTNAFSGSWRSHRTVNHLYREYAPRGAKFLTIITAVDSHQDVIAGFRDSEYKSVLAVDHDQTISQGLLRIAHEPTLLIFNKDGRVVFVTSGPGISSDFARLSTEIESALRELP